MFIDEQPKNVTRGSDGRSTTESTFLKLNPPVRTAQQLEDLGPINMPLLSECAITTPLSIVFSGLAKVCRPF